MGPFYFMIRFYFISVLLISVLSVGVPFENPFTDFSYSFLRRFGIDVSMTPITFDMSMMTDDKGNLVYQKGFDIVIFSENLPPETISIEELDFYRHKVPINLYFEIIGYGGILPEGKRFLCLGLGDVSGKALTGFMLNLKRKDLVSKGFNELQNCI